MKIKIFLAFSMLLSLEGCAQSSNNDWSYNFVVWKDHVYRQSEEYTKNVGEELGKVTIYSDNEGNYKDNFSNFYQKGTKFYAIEGVSSDQSIAIEEGEKFRMATNIGPYGKE